MIPPEPVPPAGFAPVAGPADRESFLAAQARNRRAAWRFSLLAGAGVLLMGIPLSVVITPLVAGLLVWVNDVGSVVQWLPPWLLPTLRRIVDAPDPAPVLAQLDVRTWLGLAAAAFLPGVAVMLGMSLLVRRALGQLDVGGFLLAVGARPPRPDDLEERQLANVVAEMAIAAGLPAPRLALLDAPFRNAAAVGRGPGDAALVVSRALLDELGRDETQAVIGHLVASIGNGDLRIVHRILALQCSLGATEALLRAPFGPRAFRAVRELVRAATWPRGSHPEALAALLLQQDVTDEGRLARWIGRSDAGCVGSVLRFPLLFPYLVSLMASGTFGFARLVLFDLLVQPPLAWMWRARRYLADATAVQLTRQPDALARGLRAMAAGAGIPASAGWAELLFVVPGPRGVPSPELLARRQALLARVARGGAADPAELAGMMAEGQDVARELAGTDAQAKSAIGGMASYHAPLAARLARLVRQGASPDAAALAAPRRHPGCLVALAPLFLVLWVVLLGCALALVGITLAIYGLFFAPIVLVGHLAIVAWLPRLLDLLGI